MTHEQAVALLDRVRDGGLYPPHVVNFALMMTGDLIDYGPETDEILWQVPAGQTAGGWGGDIPHPLDVRSLLDKASLGL